jgi:soluble lytic murein transglycosylase-like protein
MFLRVNPDRTAANIAVAVAAAESGLNPRAVNVNQGSTGCRCSFECRNEDWGLFQINLQCYADRLRNLGIIRRSEDLFDPATNIAAAILISDAGRNWRPWVTYLTGAYQRFFLKPGYTCS